MDNLWNLYIKILINKSNHWSYEQEWRYIVCKNNNEKDINFNIPFLLIKKVYFGCRMEEKEKKELIKLCKKINITFTCLKMHEQKFELIECQEACKYKKYLSIED